MVRTVYALREKKVCVCGGEGGGGEKCLTASVSNPVTFEPHFLIFPYPLLSLNPFPNDKFLIQLKKFADDNFKFDETGRKSIQTGRKHCGKRRNCSLRAISPFSTVFSKDLHCRRVKTRACLGKG